MNFKQLRLTLINTMRTLYIILAVALLLFSSGCASRSRLPLNTQHAPLSSEPVCLVAVLPFQNASDYPRAGVIFSKVFSAQFLASGNYILVQEGDVLKTYEQVHILPGEVPGPEEMQIVADRLNVQLLITGVVLAMREDPGGAAGSRDPVITVEVQILDGRNGQTLWTTYHGRRGSEYTKTMHFGTIFSVSDLSRQMTEEIINFWFKKGFKQCDIDS